MSATCLLKIEVVNILKHDHVDLDLSGDIPYVGNVGIMSMDEITVSDAKRIQDFIRSFEYKLYSAVGDYHINPLTLKVNIIEDKTSICMVKKFFEFESSYNSSAFHLVRAVYNNIRCRQYWTCLNEIIHDKEYDELHIMYNTHENSKMLLYKLVMSYDFHDSKESEELLGVYNEIENLQGLMNVQEIEKEFEKCGDYDDNLIHIIESYLQFEISNNIEDNIEISDTLENDVFQFNML